MVVENGFKQTELGAIPENWEIAFLDDLIDKTRSIRYGIVQPGKFDSNGRYLVRGQDYSFGWADSNTLFRVSPSIEEKYKNARLKSGDLVLTIVGASTGHVESVPNWLDGANITQTTARIPIDDSKANSEFCKQYLQSNYGWKIVLNFMKGAAQPGLNIGDIRIFKIITPPLQEQTAIANALSDMDALIAQTEKLIEKKKAIKQGAMQELLKPKEGWVSKKLGDFNFNISDGNYSSKYPKASEFKEIGIPFIRANNIKRMTVISDDMRFISKQLHEELQKGHLQVDDILITTRGEIGKVALVPDSQVGSNINAQIVRINTNRKINTKYLAYFFMKNETQKVFQNAQTGSALKQLPVNKLKEILITYPREQEQKDIATILCDMDFQIFELESKLNKLKLQKQGMMQALLTGKIRLV